LPSKTRKMVTKRVKQLKYTAGIALKRSGEALKTVKNDDEHAKIIANLKQDLKAGPGHVFGHHDDCRDEVCQIVTEPIDACIKEEFDRVIDHLTGDDFQEPPKDIHEKFTEMFTTVSIFNIKFRSYSNSPLMKFIS
jgi:hypothetical protein